MKNRFLKPFALGRKRQAGASTVRMTGVQSVHYDEAPADGGLISDFKIVSWFEDEN
jgi:hypothetical protein